MIVFNKPYLTGKETQYIQEAVQTGKISGNGDFTKRCQKYFEDKYGFGKCLLTTSCTDALEMSAILLDIQPGDEVIVPSYTFVSSALAFVREGAVIRFADSNENHPNIAVSEIEKLITPKTKAIVVVHYAGFACDMDEIMALSEKHNIPVVEDAAQAIDNYFIDKNGNKRALGSIGHLSTFSFHETKNIISGEGGLLAINDPKYFNRAEILWEKGTNRAEFFRGEVNKYGWVDTGSSFLPSEVIAAFLWAQLENMEDIQTKRLHIWDYYYKNLKELAEKGHFELPVLNGNSTNNAHMFYIICNSLEERSALIKYMRAQDVQAVFHYLSLHKSEYYEDKFQEDRTIPNSDKFENQLLRLPLYYELSDTDLEQVVASIKGFFEK
ncbi:MAG: dTDP-4-amino-4,6-dideoxygalactose transaminase [Flavobacteriales bacterium]|jgi:dTDP-4-amino-4,6-dideoxygalactose transaminase|nr:dTDP-4-amino-4,6-dideoxygalactose transaminase [Flavobacteriales bacterium]